MLNSIKARPKKSTLEIDTGLAVILTFGLVVSICFIAALVYSIWDESHESILAQYMPAGATHFIWNLLGRLGNWILIFGNFVPISLLLTLETVKFFQGFLMSQDKNLVTESTGITCRVQSSNLNEELGQVEYVFSDKTGTLTCNEMRFKYLIVGDQVYGTQRGHDVSNIPHIKNVDFEDPRVWESVAKKFPTENCQRLKEAILLLGLCHTVVREMNGEYNASSPDELAFVYLAKLVGCEFLGLDHNSQMQVQRFGQQTQYKLLDVFEFNSDRKRMSAILETPEGKIIMYCKGADSIMIPRYHKDKKHQFALLQEQVEQFASIGLRTLMLGSKELTKEEYKQFKTEYDVDMCDR